MSLNHPVCQTIETQNNEEQALSNVLQTLTQIPHPMHNSSEMNAIFEAGVTSMHSFPAKMKCTGNLDEWRNN